MKPRDARNEGDAVTYEGEPKVVANEVLVYNIENNEVKQLENPNEMIESIYRSFYFTIVHVHLHSIRPCNRSQSL